MVSLKGMKQGKLIRVSDDGKQTTGNIRCWDLSTTIFECKTLELGWHGNTSMISCIPAGKYLVRWTYSPRHAKYMYEVIDVLNRKGIRFDVANYASQLKGCIALGSDYGDINQDGELDVLNSKITNQAFEAFFNKETFELEIVDPTPVII